MENFASDVLCIADLLTDIFGVVSAELQRLEMWTRGTALTRSVSLRSRAGGRFLSSSASVRAGTPKSQAKNVKSAPATSSKQSAVPLSLSSVLLNKLNKPSTAKKSEEAETKVKTSKMFAEVPKSTKKETKQSTAVPATAKKSAASPKSAKTTPKASEQSGTKKVTKSETTKQAAKQTKSKEPQKASKNEAKNAASGSTKRANNLKATTSAAKSKATEKAAKQSLAAARLASMPRPNRSIEAPVNFETLKRGPEREKLLISVGDIIHGFRVVEKQHVPERNMIAYLLTHEATGARHLHLECDDMENTFCTTFKTIPTNSKGIPHILEHLALCGSNSFPVRDPFFNMAKRSLATYMNAWTGPDFTSYPFSSQNAKDFYNLMSVYLDAVYFPKLEYLDFLQEGIRVEMTTPEQDAADTMEAEEHAAEEDETISVQPVDAADATPSPAVTPKKSKGKKIAQKRRPKYKGVVFNEMKGALSDPNDLFVRLMQSKVFPTTTYHHNSGGDPADIVRLSHDELLQFHQEFYHPSNSFSLTYGDLPLAPHLKFMNERALNKFTRRESPVTIQDEKRYDKPVKVYVEGPLSSLSDPEKQNKIAVAWLTNNITEQFETSCMSLVSSLLLHGPNAPLYQALITSGLGTGFTAGSGYDSSYREAVFQVGLTNVNYKDVDKIERIILDTLKEAAKTGFPQERIDSLLHQLELGQRNVTTGFGIALIQGLTHVWMHGGSPIAALHFNDFLDRLKRELAADPQYFQKKIERHLLNNKHRVTQVMVATDKFTKNSTQWEGERLKKLAYRINHGQTPFTEADLVQQAKKLKHRQSKPDDVKVLPKLSLNEIDVTLPRVEVHKETLEGGVPVHLIPQPTNGIAYFYGKINLDGLPEHLSSYVPLFCTALTQTGAGDLDYKQFAQQVEGSTGTFRAYHSIVDDPAQLDVFTPHIFFRSSALERNIPKMFELWNAALQNPRFHDTQRLKTLIGLMRSRMHDSLVDSGSSYAALYASSQISPLHKLKESWSGLTQYKLMRSLDSAESLADTISKLKEIAAFVLKRNRLSVAINAEQSTFGAMQKFSSGFIGALSDSSSDSSGSWWNKPIDLASPKPTYLALPIQINYVAHVLRGAPYADADFSKLDMMTSLLSHNFLHKEVREKGGAYGSGLGHNDGVLSFYSYRDPNVRHTLQAFASARNWLAEGNLTDQQFEDAKLSLFGSLDSPVAPSAKGLAEFKYGLTHEMRQQRRERLMAVQKQDVVEMADKYLASDRISSVAVFGSAAQGKEFEQDRNWIYRTD